MDSSTPIVVVVNLSLSYGGLLIGAFLACALWGMHCIQTVYYFAQYPKDNILMKIWVIVLWCLSTAHQVVVIKGLWNPLIKNYGDSIRMGNIVPEFIYQLIFTTIVASMAQMFFVRRIYMFSAGSHPIVRWIMPALMMPLTVGQFILSVIYVTRGLSYQSTAELLKINNVSIAIQGFNMAADVCIALAMCGLLLANRGGFVRTNRLLTRLMVASVNTGAWTAIFATVVVIVLVRAGQTLMYAIGNLPLCSLYCNTILGNLTIRTFMRDKDKDNSTNESLSIISNVPQSHLAYTRRTLSKNRNVTANISVNDGNTFSMETTSFNEAKVNETHALAPVE